MPAHRLDPLLRPDCIAVVGASARVGTAGHEALVNLRKGGFAGEILPVNPGATEVEGLPCYPSLSELPRVPRHVIFAVNDSRIEACLDEAIALGIPAATVFSALHLEGERAPTLRQRVQDKALAAGLLLHGGNCMGFFNIADGTWASGFDTRDHPPGGGVVLLSQSGAGMSGILDCEERLAFSFAASTGQELCLGVEDYLDFVLDQTATKVVGLFLETSRKPEQLIAALDKARRLRIPIVALKVGKTERAAQLALSHSGALAGQDASYQAVFERYGVQRVDDMAQLAAALLVFYHGAGVPSGHLVTLHDSGGERQLAVDLAQELGVCFAQLDNHTTEKLQALLDSGLPAVNPLDAWGSGAGDATDRMRACFTTLLQDPGAALGAVVHDRAPGGDIYPAYLEYLQEAREKTGKPVFLVANHRGSGGGFETLRAVEQGMAVVDGLREFLVAVRCLLSWRDFLVRTENGKMEAPAAAQVASWRIRVRAGDVNSEQVAGQFLSDFGIPVVPSTIIESPQQLAQLAPEFSYPVVLKTAMADINHKSDVGGVVLSLVDASSVLAAYTDMALRLGPRALVAPMVQEPGVEMLLGISRDAQFGPMIVLGMGGIYAETLNDRVVLQPPFTASQARCAVDRLRLRALLDAQRGRPALNVALYCDMAARLSQFAVAFRDCVAEVDINPVQLGVATCIGLDALLIPLTDGDND